VEADHSLKQNRDFTSHSTFRQSLSPVVIYATLGAGWAGFAHWVAPPIIAAAYEGRSLWILNEVFQGRRPHPIEYYFNLWNAFAGAILLAGVLHLAIVLLIVNIGRHRKREGLLLDAGRAGSRASVVLIVLSAGFLALTVLIGPRADYSTFLEEWDAVLSGLNPWWLQEAPGVPLNAYGPLFNVLALLAWVNALAPKLIFAFAYLAYVIWLIRGYGARRRPVDLSWPVAILWLMNPFPWVEIACWGNFDVLVALACVAAVHGRVRDKDILSGICLALGILLKYLPIVLLPFLVFDQRRFRIRLFSSCSVLVTLGLGISVVVWGTSTFQPLKFAAMRESGGSIFALLRGDSSPLWLVWDSPNVDWLALPCLSAAGLSIFAWCVIRRTGPALSAVLAVLVTLLFYQFVLIRYQMVLFCLISYWALSEWEQLKRHSFLTTLLIGYFGWLASLDLINWFNVYYLVMDLITIALGFVLLARLIQFSFTPAVLPKPVIQ
jgi:hypothetical protein